MQEIARTPERAEGELRLHAAIRAVLSPGIWFVLAAQIALLFVLQWRTPADATPLVSTLAVFLTATSLMLFFYLQAGAFHALALGREALSVGEIMRAGKTVFASFVWLTLKAGLLFALVVNVLVLVALLLTGSDFKSLLQALSSFFGPATGVLAFVFVYWLPYVFVHREFRLLPSLKASLQIALKRLPHSVFLVLLVPIPAVAIGFIPVESPVLVDVLASAATGIMGWIAYIYCADILRPPQQVASGKIPV
jgi:hypothetical protein